MQAFVDALTPVSKSNEHKHPFRFTGSIKKVYIAFDGGMGLSREKRIDFILAVN
jgi:hypothetical protein